MEKFNFGENLRMIRSAKGISQEHMALSLKISQTTYSRIERQETIPHNPSPVKIAKVLGVDVIDLLPADYVPELVMVSPANSLTIQRQAKPLAKTPLGLLLLIIVTIVVTEFVYQTAYGICEALETSDEVLIRTRTIAAFVTLYGMLYWIWKLRRS